MSNFYAKISLALDNLARNSIMDNDFNLCPSIQYSIYREKSNPQHFNQNAIEMIIRKNNMGLSALDYATMANNARVAAFLAQLFYIFGQDVLGKDTQVR